MTSSAAAGPAGRGGARRAGRRAGRSRTDVLAAAARVIAERGVESTRFADVSQASGVPVSTLQYYFGNREDMIVAAFRHAVGEEMGRLRAVLAGAADADPWEQLGALLRIGVVDGQDAPETWRLWVELWRTALRDAELRLEALDVSRQWRELLTDVIVRGQAAGRFRADADALVVANQAISLMDGAGIPVALADPSFAGSATDLVLDAVATLLGLDIARSAAQTPPTPPTPPTTRRRKA
jgi:AcrR family transcriptional regulator